MLRPLAIGLTAIALSLPAVARAQELRGEITKVSQAWQTAYNKGDAAGVAALYTSDAKVLAPGAEAVSGSDGIKAFFTSDISAGGGAQNTLTTGDVTGFGDYAVETGSWVAQSKEGKHLDHGSYLTVYKKVNGAWKIYRDTWNSSMKQ